MNCARCGKKFRVTGLGWGYAYDGKYVCSYSCMRAMERADESVTEEQKKKADEMAEQGMDNQQISEELKLSRQQVGAYLGRKRRELEAAAAGPEDSDGLKLAVIRLMSDMTEVLKRIV